MRKIHEFEAFRISNVIFEEAKDRSTIKSRRRHIDKEILNDDND